MFDANKKVKREKRRIIRLKLIVTYCLVEIKVSKMAED